MLAHVVNDLVVFLLTVFIVLLVSRLRGRKGP
jgi:hypothetical protein